MPRSRSNSTFNFSQGIKKFFLSAFVVFAFVAYAIHERLTSSNGGLASASAAPASGSGQSASDPASNASASNSSAQQVPASNLSSSSQVSYKNGTYSGPDVNVFYGLVKVQATIQNGKLSSVQFLDYPSDRRTSQQINSIAMPYLQQEAIQAQSANVDIISGATLTSEGFQMSLQSALASAH
ncbi:MAG: FMN-binding protein [Chloroflexi bacterium]|nr:FMN-binding protein [Chloroflexota bacterium]